MLVDDDPAVMRGDPRAGGERGLRRDAGGGQHQIAVDGDAVIETHRVLLDGLDRDRTDEPHARIGQQVDDAFASLDTEARLLGQPFRRDQGDRNPAHRQRGGGLAPDETGTDDDGGVRVLGGRAQRHGVGQ